MNEQASLLLKKQLKELIKHPVDGFSAGLVDENNIYEVTNTPREMVAHGILFYMSVLVGNHDHWTP